MRTCVRVDQGHELRELQARLGTNDLLIIRAGRLPKGHGRAALRNFYLRLSPELEPYIAVIREARSAAAFSGKRSHPAHGS